MYILITLKDISENKFKKIRKNAEWGGIVELFAFSSIIDLWIELWCDAKDSRIRHLQTQYLIEKKINVHLH